MAPFTGQGQRELRCGRQVVADLTGIEPRLDLPSVSAEVGRAGPPRRLELRPGQGLAQVCEDTVLQLTDPDLGVLAFHRGEDETHHPVGVTGILVDLRQRSDPLADRLR